MHYRFGGHDAQAIRYYFKSMGSFENEDGKDVGSKKCFQDFVSVQAPLAFPSPRNPETP